MSEVPLFGFVFRTSGFWFRVSCFWFLVSGFCTETSRNNRKCGTWMRWCKRGERSPGSAQRLRRVGRRPLLSEGDLCYHGEGELS